MYTNLLQSYISPSHWLTITHRLVNAPLINDIQIRPKPSILLIHPAEAKEYFKNLHLIAMCNSSKGKTEKGVLCVLPCITAALCSHSAGSHGHAMHCQAEAHHLFTELCLEEAGSISFPSPADLSRQLPRTVSKGFRERANSSIYSLKRLVWCWALWRGVRGSKHYPIQRVKMFSWNFKCTKSLENVHEFKVKDRLAINI